MGTHDRRRAASHPPVRAASSPLGLAVLPLVLVLSTAPARAGDTSGARDPDRQQLVWIAHAHAAATSDEVAALAAIFGICSGTVIDPIAQRDQQLRGWQDREEPAHPVAGPLSPRQWCAVVRDRGSLRGLGFAVAEADPVVIDDCPCDWITRCGEPAGE